MSKLYVDRRLPTIVCYQNLGYNGMSVVGLYEVFEWRRRCAVYGVTTNKVTVIHLVYLFDVGGISLTLVSLFVVVKLRNQFPSDKQIGGK